MGMVDSEVNEQTGAGSRPRIEDTSYQANIIRTISPNDEMMMSDDPQGTLYFKPGASAMKIILDVLRIVDMREVRTICDFACGHGRVLRYLRAAFPDATIHAGDLNKDGVDFCAKTFGSIPFLSRDDFRDIELNESFDLIWVGSLFTHLSEKRVKQLFRFLVEHLTSKGVLIFSFQGRHTIYRQYGRHYKFMEDERFLKAYGEYETKGFGYVNYEGQSLYGIAIAKPSWLFSMIEKYSDVRVVNFTERSWVDLQDIVACTREPIYKIPDGA
jgi:SAM-dependent methyltransferase